MKNKRIHRKSTLILIFILEDRNLEDKENIFIENVSKKLQLCYNLSEER